MIDGAVQMRAGGPGYAILLILVSFPIAFFTAALATDTAYLESANMLWADFSAWLLAGAMLFGGLAAIAALFRWIASWRRSPRRGGWKVALGSALALALGLLDNFVHSRDAWTSVVPLGITLTAIVVAITLVTAWIGFAATPMARLVPASAGVRR